MLRLGWTVDIGSQCSSFDWANIHGTIKRMDWVPLRLKHKGNNTAFPTQPLDISLEGFKDCYHMNTKWKGKQAAFRRLTSVGYRSGTGTAVSLAISSRYRKVQWDLVPQGNARWYHDSSLTDSDRKKKALTCLVGGDSMDMDDCRQLILDSMEPRTCAQGTADWFIDRQLSGTSSTVPLQSLSLWWLEPTSTSSSWSQLESELSDESSSEATMVGFESMIDTPPKVNPTRCAAIFPEAS
jgi:hypothetical protein